MGILHQIRQREIARAEQSLDAYRSLMWAEGGPQDAARLEQLMAQLHLREEDLDRDLKAIEDWRQNDIEPQDRRDERDAERALAVARRKMQEVEQGFAEELEKAKGEADDAYRRHLAMTSRPCLDRDFYQRTTDRLIETRGRLESLKERIENIRKPILREISAAENRVNCVRIVSNQHAASRHEIRAKNPRLFGSGVGPPAAAPAAPAAKVPDWRTAVTDKSEAASRDAVPVKGGMRPPGGRRAGTSAATAQTH